MRRKRARTIYWLSLVGCAAMAIFGPRLGAVQSTAAMAFAPVSHPANRLGHWLAGGLAEEPAIDPGSPGAPRELTLIAEENLRLRQQVAQLTGELERLKQIHVDRQRLGQDILPWCAPVSVVGSDGDVLQVVNRSSTRLEVGMPALHYGPVHTGVAGVVSAVGLPGAQVRLITDPAVRIEGRFGRFDTAGNFVTLDTEAPLIEGAGSGLCQVARAKRQDLDRVELRPGDWAVQADARFPEEMLYFRIGEVVAIEDIPDEPGFARVVIRPAVDLRAAKELMILAR